jgi:uncharacterized protein YjbJ (UPF0337 family)
MDKNRIVGAAHQVKGAVKETVGKVTGDAKNAGRRGRGKSGWAAPRTPSGMH